MLFQDAASYLETLSYQEVRFLSITNEAIHFDGFQNRNKQRVRVELKIDSHYNIYEKQGETWVYIHTAHSNKIVEKLMIYFRGISEFMSIKGREVTTLITSMLKK